VCAPGGISPERTLVWKVLFHSVKQNKMAPRTQIVFSRGDPSWGGGDTSGAGGGPGGSFVGGQTPPERDFTPWAPIPLGGFFHGQNILNFFAYKVYF